MPIAVTDEHQELRQAAAVGWSGTARQPRPGRTRCAARRSAEFWVSWLPGCWVSMCPRTWAARVSLIELAVVLEVLDTVRAGPFLPSVTASALIVAGANDVVAKQLLRACVTGRLSERWRCLRVSDTTCPSLGW